jgi:hypothetical protein
LWHLLLSFALLLVSLHLGHLFFSSNEFRTYTMYFTGDPFAAVYFQSNSGTLHGAFESQFGESEEEERDEREEEEEDEEDEEDEEEDEEDNFKYALYPARDSVYDRGRNRAANQFASPTAKLPTAPPPTPSDSLRAANAAAAAAAAAATAAAFEPRPLECDTGTDHDAAADVAEQPNQSNEMGRDSSAASSTSGVRNSDSYFSPLRQQRRDVSTGYSPGLVMNLGRGGEGTGGCLEAEFESAAGVLVGLTDELAITAQGVTSHLRPLTFDDEGDLGTNGHYHKHERLYRSTMSSISMDEDTEKQTAHYTAAQPQRSSSAGVQKRNNSPHQRNSSNVRSSSNRGSLGTVTLSRTSSGSGASILRSRANSCSSTGTLKKAVRFDHNSVSGGRDAL